jgi:hypothetical protein
MLVASKPDMSKGGRPTDKKPVLTSVPVSLKDVGITKNESSEFQKLAAVPEKVLVKAITVVKERDGFLPQDPKFNITAHQLSTPSLLLLPFLLACLGHQPSKH